MLNKIRAFLLSLTIAAILVFSAFGTTAVYADGGTTDTECTSDGTSSECSATSAAGELAPPVDLGSAPSIDAGSEMGAAPEPEAEDNAPVLDAVPDNTTVTVVNAEGQAEPLATVDAANAIITSDPFWCSTTQPVPAPNATGCTDSFPSFTALLTFLSGNSAYSGAGVIYVDQGAYGGPESTVNFNNFGLSNLEPASLTITGGWNTGTNTPDPNGTSTFNNVSLIIGTATNPWGGSLTLNNLTLNNPSGTGIVLFATDDAVLDKVNVTNSTNGAGAEITAGNNANIRNSNFIRNKTAGLIVHDAQDVSILASSFSNPANARRQMVGLDITARGAVALLNVLANENRDAGARIDAGGPVAIGSSEFSGTKAMNGSAFIGEGLTVTTGADIALSGVTANNNFLWGASLNAGGDVAVTDSIFNGNTTESPGFIDDTGLLVTSGGTVSLLRVKANENRLLGATINARGEVTVRDSEFLGNNGVTLNSSGAEEFHGIGLKVVTLANISMLRVNASGNTEYGAQLKAGTIVDIADSVFSNNTSLNNTSTGTPPVIGKGLEIITDGAVLLTRVTLDGNQTFGAHIETGDAIFLDTVTATNNGANGVEVQANCTTVFLINGTYTGNQGYGLSVVTGQIIPSGTQVFGGNVQGDTFVDPGTCIFSASDTSAGTLTPPADDGGTTPPTDNEVVPDENTDAMTDANPPSISEPNVASPAATIRRSRAADALSAYRLSERTLSAGKQIALNSFLASAWLSRGTSLHIALVKGKPAYIYYANGRPIIVFLPASLNDLALGGS